MMVCDVYGRGERLKSYVLWAVAFLRPLLSLGLSLPALRLSLEQLVSLISSGTDSRSYRLNLSKGTGGCIKLGNHMEGYHYIPLS